MQTFACVPSAQMELAQGHPLAMLNCVNGHPGELHAGLIAFVIRKDLSTQALQPNAVSWKFIEHVHVERFWPVREYPWGACEALSSAHSDLPALKKLLFEVAYIDLKDATEQRYYVFREQQLMNLDDPTL